MGLTEGELEVGSTECVCVAPIRSKLPPKFYNFKTKSETKSSKDAPKRPPEVLICVQLPKNVPRHFSTVLHPRLETQTRKLYWPRPKRGQLVH